jgi:uncharacterized protein YuzE
MEFGEGPASHVQREKCTMGPVEYLVVGFPGNKFKGEIVPALAELVANETIRIIDLIFIKKDADGNVMSFELDALAEEEAAGFEDLDYEVDDLLNQEDILLAAEMLEPNSSAAMLVFENVWATRLRDAIVNANGKLLDNARIPAAIVDAALEYAGITDE